MASQVVSASAGKVSPARQVARGVAYLQIVFVNAYFVGERRGPWALVDTGLPGYAGRIRRVAEQLYGPDARPEAIILTHGHFDHAGSAPELARAWDVPVYAHPLELPYLSGKSDYPPQDPTVGGALAFMSRFFPHGGVDLGSHVRALNPGDEIPGLPGWVMHHTPGHTAGHASYFREEDRTLIAGDALATVNQDSARAMMTKRQEFYRPPSPFTTDWGAARRSVEELASLRPFTVGAGHGVPMSGQHVPRDLENFARRFTPPAKGRYVARPARADERGVIELPPPVADPLPKMAAGLGIAALAGAGLAYALRGGKSARRRKPRRRTKR